jgi:dipeptidyl aminopeptidase/acylaminoacyl peptidase
MIFAALIAACTVTPQDPPPSRALPVEAAYAARALNRVDRIVVSPDGRRVAYAVLTPARRGVTSRAGRTGTPSDYRDSRVFVTDIASGVVTAAGPAGASSWRPAWSPDGRRLAFYCDDGGAPGLWVWEAASKRARRVSAAPVHAAPWTGDEPAWSPDGREVFVRLRPKTAAAGPRTAPSAPPPAPLVRVRTSGAEPPVPAPKRTAPPPPDDLSATLTADLAAVRLRDGKVRVVVTASASPKPGMHRLSTTGRWVSYLSVLSWPKLPSTAFTYDLAVAPARGGKPLTLARGIAVTDDDYFGKVHRWHPSQDLLAYVREGQLWMVDLRAGTPRPRRLAPELGTFASAPLLFTQDGHALIAGIGPKDFNDQFEPRPTQLAVLPLDGGPPALLDPFAGGMFQSVLSVNDQTAWQPAGDALHTLWRDPATSEMVVVRTALSTGASAEVRRESARFDFRGGGAGHRDIVGVWESAGRAPNLYRFRPGLTETVQLTKVDPRLEAVTAAKVVMLRTTVPRFDGGAGPVNSALLLPFDAKAGDRLPTVVVVYPGGNLSAIADRFGGGSPALVPSLLFVSRGYAVLVVDAPITPRGQVGNPADELAAVVLPQVRGAVEAGYSHSGRIAVLGQSGGGYAVAALLTRTSMFRAGIAISGFYDLPGWWGHLEPGDEGESSHQFRIRRFARMPAAPWADLPRYLANSPYYQANRIETPLLLIHGEKDEIPVIEAGKLFSAGLALGKTMQLATYPGEGHAIGEGSTAAAEDMARRILAFVQRHLNGPRQPRESAKE